MATDIRTMALHVTLITSEDGSRFYKASTRIGDTIYSCIGMNPEDARAGVMNKILRDENIEGFSELPPPGIRGNMVDTIRLVALWCILAFVTIGVFMIIAKIMVN